MATFTNEMKKNIAFFDFDGTITTNDSLLELIRFSKGNFSFFVGFGILSPWLLAMKLKVTSNTRVKEKTLRYFFGNLEVKKFNDLCARFANEKLASIIRPESLKEIQKHLSIGTEVVVVSASPENYIGIWCKAKNLSFICTKLEIKLDKLTGKIDGINCSGDEKVSRITKLYNLKNYKEVFAYGDTPGDRPMLDLATKSYYKPFRN